LDVSVVLTDMRGPLGLSPLLNPMRAVGIDRPITELCGDQ